MAASKHQCITKLKIKVSPKASRNAIIGWHAESLKIAVTAAPDKGKANTAVQSLLAKQLGLAKGNIQITTGQTQAQKTVEITGLGENELQTRLKLLK